MSHLLLLCRLSFSANLTVTQEAELFQIIISIISEEAVNAVGGDDACDADWFDISFNKITTFFKLLF